MNGVDYTRRLSKEREYFRDSLKKNNEAHQRRLEETEARHEHVENKLSSNYQKDRTDLENSYKTNVNDVTDKNREAMNKQTDEFNKDLAKERENFARESGAKRKDFDQRLNDIKQSYKEAFKSDTETDAKIREAEKNRYRGNVEDLVLKQDKQLKNYQQEMSGAGADLRDSFKREKQQLVRNQEKRLLDLNQNHLDERTEIKDRLSKELAKTKEIHSNEQQQLRDYTSDKLTKAELHSRQSQMNSANEYSEKYASDAKLQHEESIKTNRQYEEEFSKVRRDAQNKIRESDNLARRRDNTESDLSVAVSQNGEINGKSSFDHKIKNMKSGIEEVRRTYEERAKADANDIKVSMERERAENRALIEKATSKVKAEKLLTVAEERLENQDLLEQQERQALTVNRDYQRQNMVEKKAGDTRLKNLKEAFQKSISDLENTRRANIEDVTLSANADKKEFLKKSNERNLQQVADIKTDSNRQLAKTVQNYEFRISALQRDIEELKMAANQKMAVMAEKSEVELEHERKSSEERRTAEVRELKTSLSEIEHKHRMESNNQLTNFHKQIAKINAQSDLKLKLISNDYESKLKEVQASSARELADRSNLNRAELERLKVNYSEEKQRLIAGYEARIQQLKDLHETQMQQLNEFKKLT